MSGTGRDPGLHGRDHRDARRCDRLPLAADAVAPPAPDDLDPDGLDPDGPDPDGDADPDDGQPGEDPFDEGPGDEQPGRFGAMLGVVAGDDDLGVTPKAMSGSGRYVVYVEHRDEHARIVRWDHQSEDTITVTEAGEGAAATGTVNHPRVSHDGGRIAFVGCGTDVATPGHPLQG